VAAFDPQLIVMFAPDHFNGFFYDLMPPFCLGVRARGAGDWDYSSAPLRAGGAGARSAALCAQRGRGSGRFLADAGRPWLYPAAGAAGGRCGALSGAAIFINGAAHPLPPMHRAVALGRAVGRFWPGGRNVLILGSGGLSHDPPTPQMGHVPPEVEEFLIAGRNPPGAGARQANVLAKGAAGSRRRQGRDAAAGPAWDEGLIADLLAAAWIALQRWRTPKSSRGGRGGHEIRAWAAAFAALDAIGPYGAKALPPPDRRVDRRHGPRFAQPEGAA
jgi:2,3-dihydroxyphenylpropionate 1,2-dioxygenase